MQEFDTQATEALDNQKNAVSFERPDRKSVENGLSAETQHVESKLQLQNSEIFSQNYDFQTARQQESFHVIGARDREREHQKEVTRMRRDLEQTRS